MNSHAGIQGMTGFGSAERGGYRVEIRSLNHRFMDVSVKMPPAIGSHEIQLRNLLKERFSRGKFDVFVSVNGEGMTFKLKVNRAMAAEIYDALKGIRDETGVQGDIGFDTLLRWKEMFISEEMQYDAGPLTEAFAAAIGAVSDMRLKEGAYVCAEINARIDGIEKLNESVMAACPQARERAVVKFKEKTASLISEAGAAVDEMRLIQEASSSAERSDVSEETERLRGHIKQIRDIFDKGGAVGRKLDFLMQELNREANTIASKADDKAIIASVIDMKAEIERAREQVQNLQ